MELEICVDSVGSAVAAERGGAERIELCSALSVGGITPSAGLINSVRAAVGIQVFIIIRPRGGNFVYSDQEMDVIRRDIREAAARGADGVVLGVLAPDETVDKVHTRELVELARPLQVTFHRAFDECNDVERALEDVIACGADRVLTSGGKSDALNGIQTLAALQRQAGNRVRIMAGGGIRISNVRDIVVRTGVQAIHTSLCARSQSEPGVNRDGNGFYGGSAGCLIREDDVREFKSALKGGSAES
jgi:copper homeostasis protein